MERVDRVYVGLMGLGVVGSGVAQILAEKRDTIASLVGCPVEIKRVLVRDPARAREAPVAPERITSDPGTILDDPSISIVIELIGGEEPAHQYIRRALAQGKHVITAIKEVIAKHGPQLLELAEQKQAAIHYEASVGGGIPLIAPFRQSLLANSISALYAIINGTTNYILTRMAKEGLDLADALREAQALGYAEPDPTNDVSGTDAAYKLAILASLAFHTQVAPDQVYREGIDRLTARDFRYAGELGYAIKLLAIAKREEAGIQVRVHPSMVPGDRILARVDGVFNAVEVDGDLTGPIMFYGRGAGSLPTTSAVTADLIELAREVRQGTSRSRATQSLCLLPVTPMEEILTRYYVRMSVRDQPGVLAQIATILGGLRISIASVIQKESDETAQVAEIVLMTHLASERAMQEALRQMAALTTVAEIGTMIRAEG
ncbi:MAG: homoserine dehydrogenase [Chloroflexi bacterium]|nr:homoserine dehydrogenase [Chloroflexota bacterium]